MATVQPGTATTVWTVSLTAPPARLAEAAAVLDAVERARAARFVFDRDRAAFTLTRAALRHILAGTIGIAPRDVPLGVGPFGKPLLGAPHDGSGLQFNASHSHDRALIAITRGQAVGVDIEHRRPMDDLAGLAAMVLSVAERRAFAACAPDDQLDFFLGAWTRKEAYLKAVGEGLTRAPTLLECSALLGGPEAIRDLEEDPAHPEWSVMAWRLEDQYRASLVTQRPFDTITFETYAQ